jgi:acyl-CoA thioester hydrolase
MTAGPAERFRYYLRVRYQECDAQHVVFNARYSDYVDLAVSEFLRACFPGCDPFDGSFEIQTVRQLIEWKGSARFNDVVEISCWTTRTGTTCFMVAMEMRRAGKMDVLVTAETVYVVVDAKTWAKRALSQEEVQALGRGGAGQSVDHAGYARPS